jgi:hypothetical protein
MAETVRIAPEAREILSEIAESLHVTMTEALSRALREYRKELFLRGLAADFAALTPEERAEEQAELKLWDTTLMDGLEDE